VHHYPAALFYPKKRKKIENKREKGDKREA
jgi:hypothetical protein